MASVGRKVHWDEIRPGDLLFYDGDDDGTADHVDTYVGRLGDRFGRQQRRGSRSRTCPARGTRITSCTAAA
jgi:cell wall-associated NlpC family hydrolase